MGIQELKSADGYRGVKETLLQRIRTHAWPPGSLLPGEIELAGEFGVARGTVNRALRELTDEGFLERRRKGGTRVRQAPLRAARFEIQIVRAAIEETGAAYSYELLQRREEEGPKEVRRILAARTGEQLLRLLCLHRADGKPYQVEERWISLAALPEARDADFTTLGPNEWLVQTVPYTEVEIRILASAANRAVAKALALEPGVALLTTSRTTWLDGVPLTHVRLTFHEGHELVTRY
jgi:GntR family transcriptional regulator, histidine utilization repressor